MNASARIELGLTIPLQRHLRIRALPRGQEPDRRFCWDLHVISLRGRPSLLPVHCYTRYTFVLYALGRWEREHLPELFLDGLRRSLWLCGFPCGSDPGPVQLRAAAVHQDPRLPGGGIFEPCLGGCNGRRAGPGRERLAELFSQA